MINENTLNFIRFSSGFNNLKKEELETFAENEIFELNEYNASEEKQRKHFYTLLQSTDGTQGVEQEDGKYTHTAWSYSSDGTDRFSTVYPKLNLLKNTKSQSYTSTGTTNNNSFNIYSLDGAVSDILNKPITITYDYSITNSPGTWSGTIRPTYGLGGTNQSVSNTNLSGTHKETTTFKAVSQNSYGIATSGLPAGTKVTIKNLKVELGSDATPYMPSASEVTKSDWPSYMGQYTDYTLEDSINPSSYTWREIQGKYFYTLEDVNTNGTLKSYIIECLKLSLQTRWGNNLEYHIDRKTKYLNKLTGMQA